jgi:hypothetical protein
VKVSRVTTIGELALELQRLGVRRAMVSFAVPDHQVVLVHDHGRTGVSVGYGADLVDAVNRALLDVEHQIARGLAAPPVAP